MRLSARYWGCFSSFQASQAPIPHFTNARMPLFWQRPSSGWRPIRIARTRLLTSPIAILSDGRTCGQISQIFAGWSWPRHDTSTFRGPCTTRVGYGMGWSKGTDCRNTASKRCRLGLTQTAYSHRITISFPIRARPAASDSTTWWTLRKCFFACFQIFDVTESFHDQPSAQERFMTTSVVLITGALTGIGRATALAFAREGARLVVSGRREDAGLALVAELRTLGAEAEFIRADVRRESDVQNLVDRTVARFGRLDVAVNNARTEGTPGPVTDQIAASYDVTFYYHERDIRRIMKHHL